MDFGRAGSTGFGGNLRQAINAPGAEQQVGALCAECSGGRGAEAARGAGDHDPLIP
jgi:hypothetical protein